MSLSQLESVETNLRNLGKRMPQMPVHESLILRAAMILGRDTTALLDRLLKPAGLAEGEFRLLMSLLAHEGQAFAGDLCAALGQSPANLTRIADALVERGFVGRDPDLSDRRRMRLSLLPEGERLLHEMLPGVCVEVTALFAGFTGADKQQMLQFFKRLLAGIDKLGVRDATAEDAA
ncbi:MAG: MarR family transcriptional regulator [Pseudomonadota bacterium]